VIVVVALLSMTAVILAPMSSAQSQSQLTVASEDGNGKPISTYYTISSRGQTMSVGFTPITVSLNDGASYTVVVANSGSCDFQRWSDGGTSPSRIVPINNGTQLVAIYSCGSQPGGGPGTITIYDHRMPQPDWAPCFAASCTNPLAPCKSNCTGPSASMWVILYNSTGGVVKTGLSNERGLTFSGLTIGATYYLFPADCDNCHNSTHSVLFSHWGDDGSSKRPRAIVVTNSSLNFDAWYTCTNGCGG
jgi:hypothetical protein